MRDKGREERWVVATRDALQLLVCCPPRQSSHPLRVPPPPFDVQVYTCRILPTSEQIRPRGDGIASQFPLRDHDRVPPHSVLVGFPRPCEDNVQLLLAPIARSIFCGGGRNNSIPVTSGTFDDRPGPCTDEIVGLPSDVWRDAFALCVEEDDATEAGLFQDVGVDEVHFAEDSEEFALDIKGRERTVWEWFKPASNTFKEVVVNDRLGQRCSGSIVHVCKAMGVCGGHLLSQNLKYLREEL